MKQIVRGITGVVLLLQLGCSSESGGEGEGSAVAAQAIAAPSAVAGENASAAALATKAAGSTVTARGKAIAAGQNVAADAARPAMAGLRNSGSIHTQLAGQSSLASSPAPAVPALAPAPTSITTVPPANPNSARRDPSKDWREYANAARKSLGGVGGAALSVYDSRVATTSANFSNVPVWTDAEIWAEFRASRDRRHMLDSSNFVRRPTWMYPDDGCWIRAELAAIAATESGKAKPHKLFSFGSLTVSTTNAPGGSVSWWYHVVPVVRSASSGVPYVLDAAIDPTQPLPWQTWLLRQVPSLPSVQVTVADSGAYGPFDPVTGGVTPPKPTVVSDMQGYMGAEWSRQVSLSRDPVTLLGYFPPWSNVGKDFNQDRRSDILWHHRVNGTVQPWYMNGTTLSGWANLPYTVAESSGWKFAGNGDFNRDGKTDIVWHHGASGLTQVWYMDGTTRLSFANLSNTVPTSSGWIFAGADDFNYDGKTDVVWHNGTTGYTQIWYLNDSLGLISWPSLAPAYLVTDASGWRFAGTGDFNRDGRTDVIWKHGVSGTYQMWYLDQVTLTSFANLPYTVADSTGWRFFSARDFSYDGHTDIVWQHGGVGSVQLWTMNGLTRTSFTNLANTVTDASGWFGAGY